MGRFMMSCLGIICCSDIFAQHDFLSQQEKYARVKTAVSEKRQGIAENLRTNGLTTADVHILITAYKDASGNYLF